VQLLASAPTSSAPPTPSPMPLRGALPVVPPATSSIRHHELGGTNVNVDADGFVWQSGVLVRCPFLSRPLRSRSAIEFHILLRLKPCHACGQCHSSRYPPLLPVVTVNYAEPLKAPLITVDAGRYFLVVWTPPGFVCTVLVL
jgi:hypothetical protein